MTLGAGCMETNKAHMYRHRLDKLKSKQTEWRRNHKTPMPPLSSRRPSIRSGLTTPSRSPWGSPVNGSTPLRSLSPENRSGSKRSSVRSPVLLPLASTLPQLQAVIAQRRLDTHSPELEQDAASDFQNDSEKRLAPISIEAPFANKRRSSEDGNAFKVLPDLRQQPRRQSLPCVHDTSATVVPTTDALEPSAEMVATSDFDICTHLARKHNLQVTEVKRILQDFRDLDTNANGLLSRSEFERSVCKMCNVQEVDQELVDRHWKVLTASRCQDNSQSRLRCIRHEVGFEDFLLWSTHSRFEQQMVSSKEERRLRSLALKNGWNMIDVEKARMAYRRFDADNSGAIDLEEFRYVLAEVMNARSLGDISEGTLQRYFNEVDVDGNGEIDVEEFVQWYFVCLHGLGT